MFSDVGGSVLDLNVTIPITCTVVVLTVPLLVIFTSGYRLKKKHPTDGESGSVKVKNPWKEALKLWLNDIKHPTQHALTGKESHSSLSIGLSLFSSSMGLWALTGPVEVGYIAGWWGVIGYASCCIIPYFLFLYFASGIRRLTQMQGFTLNDAIKKWLGVSLYYLCSIISATVGWLGCVASFVSMIGFITEINKSASYSNSVFLMLVVAICATVYTCMGGFTASLYTDQVQGAMILILTIYVGAAMYHPVRGEISDESWDQASIWPTSGICTAAVLNISVVLVTYVDLYFIQKFYASKDDKVFRNAIIICSVLYFPVILFFGAVGVLLLGAVKEGLLPEPEWVGNGLFTLVNYVDSTSLTMVTIMISTLCALSTADSRVLLFGNIFGNYLEKKSISLQYSRLIGLLIVVTCVMIASFQPASVMSILYCSNLLGCLTGPLTIMCGWKHARMSAAWISIVLSFITILTFGWSYMGTFLGGFQWFMFPLGFYEWSCFYTYLAVIAIAFSSFIGLSLLFSRIYPKKQEPQLDCVITMSKIDCGEGGICDESPDDVKLVNRADSEKVYKAEGYNLQSKSSSDLDSDRVYQEGYGVCNKGSPIATAEQC